MSTPVTNEQIGKELVQSALGGLGLGTGAASLYYLLNGLRTAELPVGNRMAGVLPGATTKKTKKPSRSPDSPINTYKTAAPQWLTQLQSQAHKLIGDKLPKEYPFLSKLLGTGPTQGATDMWRMAGNIGMAGLGGYAGLSAVNHIADKQRVADSKDDVENARKEYFAALTGKTAAQLDTVFDQLKTADAAGKPSALEQLAGFFDRGFGNYVGKPALLTALGGGLIGGTYMYNQVKDRTKSENLRRAAAARARLAGLQKTPYVDPVELAALTQK